MGVMTYFLSIKKRIKDKDLLNLKAMIEEEVERRQINDSHSTMGKQ